MLRSLRLGLTASIALTFQTTNAFWRMPCGIIQLGRVDPIINPGTVSGHSHIVSGPNSTSVSTRRWLELSNADFDEDSNHDSLRLAQCTSCTIQADKSAYWTPSLYYEMANASFVSVPDSGVIIYYLRRGLGNATAFPPGFKMVSGVPGRRSYDSTTLTYGNSQYPPRPIADRVSYNCIDYSNPKPETHGFPSDFNCPGGFRAQIHFPTCWDGVNLYKSDQSHVAYLSQIDNGVCPPTHPVLLPHLFYETYYAVDQIDTSDGGRFLLSTGDLTGYGYHGDFLNGWDPEVQEEAVSSCLASVGSGQIEDCPVLQANNDGAASSRCPLQPSLVNEKVTGILPALPGCNPPTSGPATVVQQNCPANFTGTGPRLIPAVGSTLSLQNGTVATYRGCYQELPGSRALSGARTVSANGMTTNACAHFCRARGFSIAGTEYSTECYCGNTITTSVVDSAQCNMVCSGSQLEYCGAGQRLSVWTLSTSSNLTTTSSSLNTDVLPTATTVSDSSLTSTSFATSTCSISSNVTLSKMSTLSSNVPSTGPGSTTSSSTTTSISNTVPSTAAITTIATSTSSSGTSLTSSTTRVPSTGFVTITTTSRASTTITTLLTTSRTTTAAPTPTAIIPTVDSANYVGCYTDIRTSRTLRAFYQGDVFTPSACAALAVARNYRYFGLEYGKECWADNTIAGSASPTAESACNIPCVGDSYVLCGGHDAIGIFENELAVSND